MATDDKRIGLHATAGVRIAFLMHACSHALTVPYQRITAARVLKIRASRLQKLMILSGLA